MMLRISSALVQRDEPRILSTEATCGCLGTGQREKVLRLAPCGVSSTPMMLKGALGKLNISKRGPYKEHLQAQSMPLSDGLRTHHIVPQLIPTNDPQEGGDPRLISDSGN